MRLSLAIAEFIRYTFHYLRAVLEDVVIEQLQDVDADYINNVVEAKYGSNDNLADSDGDGIHSNSITWSQFLLIIFLPGLENCL